jgi:hypothetical protein
MLETVRRVGFVFAEIDEGLMVVLKVLVRFALNRVIPSPSIPSPFDRLGRVGAEPVADGVHLLLWQPWVFGIVRLKGRLQRVDRVAVVRNLVGFLK